MANRNSPDITRVERWAQLEADIANFVEGGLVTRSLMKRLEPGKYEHWTLRSVRPNPSLRVFGRFAEPGVFVATHVVERRFLKEKWSLEWELEKLKCEEHWRSILGDYAPYSAVSYAGYITGNAIETVGR